MIESQPQIIRLDKWKSKQLKWLWPGRIPLGQITILEGDPGTAKSQLTCKLAYHVSTGTTWPDGELCEKGDVVIGNAEDPEEEVIKPRLIAVGADEEHTFTISAAKDDTQVFTIPDHVPAFEAAIIGRKLRLLVFDPLESFLSTSVDNYRNHHIRRALKSLELMAKRQQCAVVIVRHLIKDDTKKALYRGSGSIGIIGAARSGLSVGHDPTDKTRSIVVPTKANWSVMKPGIAYKIEPFEYTNDDGELISTSRINWDGEVKVTADQLITVVEPEAQASDVLAQCLRDELSAGPKLSKEVIATMQKRGFARKAVFDTVKYINVRISKNGDEWQWELPTDEDKATAANWAGQTNL